METELRIVVKDCRRRQTLRIALAQVPFVTRQFFVRTNGQGWPQSGRPVSLTRVLTGLRKSLVRTFGG